MFWAFFSLVNAVFVPVNQYNLTGRLILKDLSNDIPYCESTDLNSTHQYTFCSNNPDRGNPSSVASCATSDNPCTLEGLNDALGSHLLGISIPQEAGGNLGFPNAPFLNTNTFSVRNLQQDLNEGFLYSQVTFSTPSFTFWMYSEDFFFFAMCFLKYDAYTTDVQKQYCCHGSVDTANSKSLEITSVCVDLPGDLVTGAQERGVPVLRSPTCSFERDMRAVCKTKRKLNEFNILSPVLGTFGCDYACVWPCFTRFLHPDCALIEGSSASYSCRTSSLNHNLRPLQCNNNIREYWTDEFGSGCLHPQEIVLGENAGQSCLPGDMGCTDLRCSCPAIGGCPLHPFCNEQGTLFETSGKGVCLCNAGFSGDFCEKRAEETCHFSQHLPKGLYQYLP